MATPQQQNIAFTAAQLLGGRAPGQPGYNPNAASENAIVARGPAPAPAPAAPPPPRSSAPSAPAGPSPAQIQAQQQAAAAAAAQARAEANYHSGLSADTNAINTGISTGAQGLGTFIGDAFNGSGGFVSQQNSLNDSRVQNNMSRLQGMQDVRDMVHNGIQGGGVVLDNDGAGTSSAGDALARAYGIQGRQQASKVGTQFAQGQHTIQTGQDNLDRARANFIQQDVPGKKMDTINNIVSNATSMLTYLNAIASGANLPDMVDINQKIAQIKAQATAALANYDGQLQQTQDSTTPLTPDASAAKASQLITQGVAPAHEFDFTSQMPAQLQNTGPSASSLPIFIAPNNKDNSVPQTA